MREFGMRNGDKAAPAAGDSALRTSHSALARIELGAAELPKFLTDGIAARVAAALKKIGYAHVTLDLQGYRRGSLNELKIAGLPTASVLKL